MQSKSVIPNFDEQVTCRRLNENITSCCENVLAWIVETKKDLNDLKTEVTRVKAGGDVVRIRFDAKNFTELLEHMRGLIALREVLKNREDIVYIYSTQDIIRLSRLFFDNYKSNGLFLPVDVELLSLIKKSVIDVGTAYALPDVIHYYYSISNQGMILLSYLLQHASSEMYNVATTIRSIGGNSQLLRLVVLELEELVEFLVSENAAVRGIAKLLVDLRAIDIPATITVTTTTGPWAVNLGRVNDG